MSESTRVRQRGVALTDRQRQVLELIERGHTNYEIAQALGVSLEGAKYHVREVMTKLGADSREEAVRFWREEQRSRRRWHPRALFAWPWLRFASAAGAGLLVVVVVAAFAVTQRGADVREHIRVVYIEHPTDGKNGLMIVLDEAGAELVRTSGDYFGQSWSPDGARLAVFSSDPSGFLVSVFDTAAWTPVEYRLRPGEVPHVAGWSPDSTRLVVTLATYAVLFDSDGRFLAETEPVSVSDGMFGGAWTPDSQRFALNLGAHISVLSRDGNNQPIEPPQDLGPGPFAAPKWKSVDELFVADMSSRVLPGNAGRTPGWERTFLATIKDGGDIEWEPGPMLPMFDKQEIELAEAAERFQEQLQRDFPDRQVGRVSPTLDGAALAAVVAEGSLSPLVDAQLAVKSEELRLVPLPRQPASAGKTSVEAVVIRE